jgi:heptosyltransferase III
MTNILVIILRYIGDTLLMTPVVTALRDAHPGAKISVLVFKGTEDVVRYNSQIDEVIVFQKGGPSQMYRFWRGLRGRRFDCVIDLTDSDRAAIASYATGAPVRVGFNVEQLWRGRLYTHALTGPVAGVHRISRNMAALAAIGQDARETLPILRTSPVEERQADELLEGLGSASQQRSQPLVLVQPGARYGPKAWPEARFAELIDRLARQSGCRIVVGASPSERPLAEAIVALTRGPVAPQIVCAPLAVYIALLKNCDLFIGNDSGPMHLAAAHGTAVVALFGPSDPVMWRPMGGPAAVIHKGVDCGGCSTKQCLRGGRSCMQSISVDEVFSAAVGLLAERQIR